MIWCIFCSIKIDSKFCVVVYVNFFKKVAIGRGIKNYVIPIDIKNIAKILTDKIREQDHAILCVHNALLTDLSKPLIGQISV